MDAYGESDHGPGRTTGAGPEGAPERRHRAGPDAAAGGGDDGEAPPDVERPLFLHPEWTVGLVLVAAVISLLFGILVRPVWLIVGSPFIVVLVLWIYVKLVGRPSTG